MILAYSCGVPFMGSDEEASPQEELDEAAAYRVKLAQLVEILRHALAEELERHEEERTQNCG
jgi:hypothetical protein